MFCTKCGKQLKEENKFCPACGNVVTLGKVVMGNTSSRKNKKKVLSIVGLCVLLVIGGIGVTFLLRDKGQEETEVDRDVKVNVAQVDTEECEKEEKEEKENKSINNIKLSDYGFEWGGNVVGKGEDIFYSDGSSIIYRDGAGNERILYAGNSVDRLYLIEDRLFFSEWTYEDTNTLQWLCSINLDGSNVKGIDITNWISWGYYEDCIYYTSYTTGIKEWGESRTNYTFTIKRYSENDEGKNNFEFLHASTDYTIETPYLFCMDPMNEGAILYKVLENEMDTKSTDASAHKYFYVIKSTDFNEELATYSYVGGLWEDMLFSEDYVYICRSPYRIDSYNEPQFIECIDPITRERILGIEVDNDIYDIMACYGNDLIVYAYIADKWGIYRITEEAMRNYQYNANLQTQLLAEINRNYYDDISDPKWWDRGVYIAGDTLYYNFYGGIVGKVNLDESLVVNTDITEEVPTHESTNDDKVISLEDLFGSMDWENGLY